LLKAATALVCDEKNFSLAIGFKTGEIRFEFCRLFFCKNFKKESEVNLVMSYVKVSDRDTIYRYIDRLIDEEDFKKRSDYIVAKRHLYDCVLENLRGGESKKDLKAIVKSAYKEIMDYLDEEGSEEESEEESLENSSDRYENEFDERNDENDRRSS